MVLLAAGEFKLADFGLARIFGSPERRLTNQVGALAALGAADLRRVYT
jgi:hypothetical protein